MVAAYEQYKLKITALIKAVLEEYRCQPILFVGSGFSKRYFGAPGWSDLLKSVALNAGLTNDELSYIRQVHHDDQIKVGTALSERVHQWAWTKGKNNFPAELFAGDVDASIFMKNIASEILREATPSTSSAKVVLKDELEKLTTIRPHAIITTNFDAFLEKVFPDYAPIIGETVIRYDAMSFGEIYKIHGCVSDPRSLVLTGQDYAKFDEKKKYISAKLVAYFAEHPVFIFGYGLNDPNVTAIIESIGEMLGDPGALIPNIFYVKWAPDIGEKASFQEEHIVGNPARNYRVRAIDTESYGWIFEALVQDGEIGPVNTKVLRALAARAYKLIRSDIPSRKVEVDYAVLERITSKDGELSRILGIAEAGNANMTHPYTITEVAEQLGLRHWTAAHKLIVAVKEQKGVDLKASDNRYHIRLKTGKSASSRTSKYSSMMVDILKATRDGEDYQVKD